MTAYVSTGSEIIVNTLTASHQDQPRIAHFSNGSYVVIWTSIEGDTVDSVTLKAQLFDQHSNRIGTEFTVETHGGGMQVNPQVAALADDSFVVTWQTEDSGFYGATSTIAAQHFSSGGVMIGSEFAVNSSATPFPTAPAITALGDGSYVVSWDDFINHSVRAQVFSADGTRIGSEFVIGSYAGTSATSLTVQALANGGFAAAWNVPDGSGQGVKVQVFSAAGSEVTGEFMANSQTADNQSGATIVSLVNGNFAVLWTSYDAAQDGSYSAIKGQVFSATGIALGSEFLVNQVGTGYQVAARASALADGGFIVAWSSADPAVNPYDNTLQARVFGASGDASGNEFQVDGFNSISGAILGGLTTLPGGTVLVSYSARGADGDGNGVLIHTLVPASAGQTAPTIVSNGGGNDADIAVDEYRSFVTNSQAYDPDGPQVASFAITGGADAARFTIDAATGRLNFVSAPEFANPADADGNNIYEVVVTASDGTLTDSQTLHVRIQDVDETVTFAGAAQFQADENQQLAGHASASSAAALPIYYEIVGGADAALLTVDPFSGTLTFVAEPDFENPGDADGNNSYEVLVMGTNGVASATAAFVVQVQDVADGANIVSPDNLTINENNNFVVTVQAQSSTESFLYAITGGTDARLFQINQQTGDLYLASAPDYEVPLDAEGDNIYQVEVTAWGQLSGAPATQLISVTVANVIEAPVILSGASANVLENQTSALQVQAWNPEGHPLVYSIVSEPGNVSDAARFTIDASTGQLSFLTAPNFEMPTDFNGDNRYELTISVADPLSNSATLERISVHVGNVNEAPVITSNGGGSSASVSVAENTTAVTTTIAADPDGTAVTYSITGGTDMGRFTINLTTGALRFLSSATPNFEAPADSNGDNIYNVVVSASDGVLNTSQSLAVTVTNANDPITFTSSNNIIAPENFISYQQVQATDQDAPGATYVYAISGGPDAALFSINSATGLIQFITAPDYENPTDLGANNVYNVTVSASNNGDTGYQSLMFQTTNGNDAPVITSQGGGASGTVAVAENTQAVTTVLASDQDGTAVTYSISGGADAAKFTINAATGVLAFAASPNFEAPGDAGANNVYDVIVKATSGGLFDTQVLAISVTNANDAPVITSSATYSMAEGSLFAGMVAASDPDGTASSFAITGGVDAARFTINAATGALSFVGTPNYEAPSDSNGDNVYQIVVSASDGTLTASQAISVQVTNVDEAPVFTSFGGGSSASVAVAENSLFAGTPSATDPEGSAVTYTIAGGSDAARFTLNSAGNNAIVFVNPANYEAPGDANADNVYEIVLRATDSTGHSTLQSLAITITNANEAPVFTSFGGASQGSVTINENSTTVATLSAVDPEGTAPVYSIWNGTDMAKFTINSATGVLSLINAPNFEAPTDSNGDNVYNVVVAVTSGGMMAFQTVSATVANVNEAPVITTNGGSDAASVAISENSTAVTTVASSDPEGTVRTYSIAGGLDAAKFAIDAATGALTFIAAPNYEAPGDSNGDNVYQVVVAASDGSLNDSQTISVSVGNVNEAPSFTSSASHSALENSTAAGSVAASDPEGTALTYSIVGGADAAKLTINAATGALSFVNAPNYEGPGDADGNNAYEVTVRASDGSLTTIQAVTVSVGNVNEAPVITSQTIYSVAENATAVGTVAASDPDGNLVTYAITGGADAARFTINAATGALSFVAAPNYEVPSDANGDNAYEVTVQASDGSLSATQAVTVTVGNVNEAPSFTSSASQSALENATTAGRVSASDPEGDALIYTIVGGADAAKFNIDAQTGALSFIAAPNYETPVDADGDNAYEVTVRASDGSLTTIQAVTVSVGNVNEAPIITSQTVFSVNENASAVTMLASTDPEGTARTYAISGGTDAAKFTINAATGALSFVAAPNYEAPTDSNGDNVYQVVVVASDGSLTDGQTINVTVANVNEAPVITSNGGGDTAAITVNENTSAVTTLASTDPEGTARTYAISGGTDASKFTINAATGALSFVAAPNYEAPTDSNGDNVYQVAVVASDGSLTDSQTISVTVANVNEAPVITSNGGGDTASITINENTSAVTTLASTDPEGTARTYAISGGSDAAKFSINAATGALSFVAAPNYEAPTDSNGDNIYNVVVVASDGSLTDSQMINVTVANVIDGLTLTGTSKADILTGGVAEDTISGFGGNDTLNGGGGSDTIDSGDGNDVLTGGAGADRLTGGAGADTFVYQALGDSSQATMDFLTDFSTAQNDKISLSAIDANTGLTGDQAFNWIGTGAFTNVAGQLRYYQSGGDTFVTGDVNGDGLGDFLIQMDPLLTLAANNFVL